ncbi:MAG: transposase [Candidatus Wenzhouxiangella sp. M2_3B_020]
MTKSRFAEHQIVAILNAAESGVPVKEVCRKYAVSSATYYKWKSMHGGLDTSDLKRLSPLEYAKRARVSTFELSP